MGQLALEPGRDEGAMGMSEGAATWWNRPVWPTTRAVTPRERLAGTRSAGRRLGRALVGTPALVALGALGAAVLALAMLANGVVLARPAALWLGGTALVTLDVALLAHRVRTRAGRASTPMPRATAPLAAALVAALLVGVPWVLAGQTSSGATLPLGAVLEAPVVVTTPVGDRVALAGDGTAVTQLDLATAAVTTTDVGSAVLRLQAVGDDLLVTAHDAVVLLDGDGAVVWRRVVHPFEGPFPVAAADGVVVLVTRPLPEQRTPATAVAVRRDGTEAWRRDDVTSPASMPVPFGGVLDAAGTLPTQALLAAGGRTAVVDASTGTVVRQDTGLEPVAVLDDTVLWQGARDASGECTATVTRGAGELWTAEIPCVEELLRTGGADQAVYVHLIEAARTNQAQDNPEGHAVQVRLDLTSGRTVTLDDAWVLGLTPDSSLAFARDPGPTGAGRVVSTLLGDGGPRWAFPAPPRAIDVVRPSTANGTLVVTTAPLGLNPLAGLRTREQVTVLDPATGTVTAWLRCSTEGGTGAVALEGARALALCTQPDGTLRATLLG